MNFLVAWVPGRTLQAHHDKILRCFPPLKTFVNIVVSNTKMVTPTWRLLADWKRFGISGKGRLARNIYRKTSSRRWQRSCERMQVKTRKQGQNPCFPFGGRFKLPTLVKNLPGNKLPKFNLPRQSKNQARSLHCLLTTQPAVMSPPMNEKESTTVAPASQAPRPVAPAIYSKTRAS